MQSLDNCFVGQSGRIPARPLRLFPEQIGVGRKSGVRKTGVHDHLNTPTQGRDP